MAAPLLPSLQALPADVIGKIAAADYTVYNALVRLCTAICALFSMDRRLDMMIKFGVTIELRGTIATKLSPIIEWRLAGVLHTVWGPARVWADGGYQCQWYGDLHRADGPARLVPYMHVEWRWHGLLHRPGIAECDEDKLTLANASCITILRSGVRVQWHVMGRLKCISWGDRYSAEEARAEIEKWAT